MHHRNPELRDFKRRHKENLTANGIQHDGKYNFMLDAVRFSHKVFALTHAGVWRRCEDVDILIWLDADTVTHAPVTNEFLEGLLKEDEIAGQFNRTNSYPETGFLIFSLPGARELLKAIREFYIQDRVFTLQSWTDCHVYQHFFNKMTGIANLSGEFCDTSHPIIHVFGHFLDHLKGPRKQIGKSNKGRRDLTIKRSEAYWND